MKDFIQKVSINKTRSLYSPQIMKSNILDAENPNTPIFSRRGPLEFWDIVACGLNSAIGQGTLRLGAAFNASIVFSFLTNVIVAVTAYLGLSLYVYSASFYHEATFEEIWCEAFSPKTVVIPGIISILASFAYLSQYVLFVESTIQLLFDKYHVALPNYINNTFTLGILLTLFFFLPCCISSSLKTFVRMSYTSLFFFLVLFIYIIYRFIESVANDGFNPNNQLSYFNVKYTGEIVTATVFAYGIVPYAWHGLRHAKEPTLKNWHKIFATTMGICFIFYVSFGLISYFIFFENNTSGTILDYFPDDILNLFGYICAILLIMLTAPDRLNSVRYIMLTVVNKSNFFPKTIWAMTGICIIAIAVILATLTEYYQEYFYIACDILSILLIYEFPAVFYIKAYKMSDMKRFVSAIVILVFGVILLATTIYHYTIN